MDKVKRTIWIVAILALLAEVSRPVAAWGIVQPARIHPLLVQLAAESPDQEVSVIVQKTSSSSAAEQLAADLGGEIIKDLYIINAFAAEMTANAALELSRSPYVRWVSPDAPVFQSGGPNSAVFTAWATRMGVASPNGFVDVDNILSPVGINQVFGSGGNSKAAFTGFQPEYTPGLSIKKIEIVLRLYVPVKLAKGESPTLIPYVEGEAGSGYTIPINALKAYNSEQNAGTVYFNITAKRKVWNWTDLKTLEVLIDQSLLASDKKIYYDAVGVRLTMAAGKDTTSPLTLASSSTYAPVNTNVISNSFNAAVRATEVWNEAPAYLQGQGMTVAVVDSGSFNTNGIGNRLIGEVNFNSASHDANDRYGHGTFVAGVIADGGGSSGGKYFGIAPQANILAVRVSNDLGMSSESDVVNAFQWIYTNRAAYNIRVVNISLNSAVMQPYNSSPLDAALEILWFNGIVVVVSAGNNGSAALFPPANDPFVITVGAANDMGTAGLADDVVASYSAYGVDETGYPKPDLVAPGSNLIAYLPDNNVLSISNLHPENQVTNAYFRMSGTSMSAPIVSGAAAILLQSNPSLTPDQVKHRLMATTNRNWPGYDPVTAGSGYLDLYAAVHGTTTDSANTNLTASQLLWTGSEPITWNNDAWNSVAWGSVSWGSVAWGSVAWGSVSWGSDYWEK